MEFVVPIAVLVIIVVIVVAKSVNTRRHHAENLQRLIEARAAAGHQESSPTAPSSAKPDPAAQPVDDPEENP